jgi:hypothetical protein
MTVILNVTEGGVKDLLYLPLRTGAEAPLNQRGLVTRQLKTKPRHHPNRRRHRR